MLVNTAPIILGVIGINTTTTDKLNFRGSFTCKWARCHCGNQDILSKDFIQPNIIKISRVSSNSHTPLYKHR